MGELEIRKFLGMDLGKTAVRLSIYDEAEKQMTEDSFPLDEADEEDPISAGFFYVQEYLRENDTGWDRFHGVSFTMEDPSEENRDALTALLDEDFKKRHGVHIMTRFRAYVEYVFHQERAVWDRNTLLLDYSGGRLRYILSEQIRPSKQKAYRAAIHEMNLEDYGIYDDSDSKDQNFSRLMKHFLVQNPAHIIFLTGEGFEGNWMKKTLTYMCAGRRVFMGQNLYANGACLFGTGPIPFMEEGMLLLRGPDMVCHTVGVTVPDGGKMRYVPITSIGREWYNTKGSLDIILDKSQKVELFFHNALENEMECSSCEITDLPARPPKTTRIRIQVQFSSKTEGVVLLKDLGFGTLYPGTGKVSVFPFRLIS